MQSSPHYDAVLDKQLRLIVACYQQLTGRALIADVQSDIVTLRGAVWNAPRAIVAHGCEDDQIFFYGNRKALQLFEMDFDEFTRLASHLSAEPMAQEERVKLLKKVARQGYVDGYSGIRIAKSGRRFIIIGATVWNLFDRDDGYHGQAAVFDEQPA